MGESLFTDIELRRNFGSRAHGGLFVSVLDEVREGFESTGSDRDFVAESWHYMESFAGPIPLMTFARRISERHGRSIYLKREDAFPAAATRALTRTLKGLRK